MTIAIIALAFAALSAAAYKFGVDSRESGQWSAPRTVLATGTARRA